MMKIRADKPLDPIRQSVLSAISDVADQFGISVFLVGATAREIILEHIFDSKQGRETRDLDFAFALESWDQFKRIKASLAETPGFEESDKEAQRMYFRLEGLAHPFIIDLIPFGHIESRPNQIAWPPEMSIYMNVAGFQDVLSAAIDVEFMEGRSIKIASLAGISVLKVFAWGDRRHEASKDAEDLATLMNCYATAGNQNRLYEEAADAFEAVDFNLELAGSWLLGWDAAKIVSEKTAESLLIIMTSRETADRLILDMTKGIKWLGDPVGLATQLRDQFLKGFKAARAHK